MPNTWEDLEELEENWDSYKGRPTTPEAIASGKSILEILKYDSQIFPTADGGVSLEWHVGGKSFIISLDENGVIEESYFE